MGLLRRGFARGGRRSRIGSLRDDARGSYDRCLGCVRRLRCRAAAHEKNPTTDHQDGHHGYQNASLHVVEMVADNSRMAVRLAGLVAVLLLATVGLAGWQGGIAEWSQWRGANRDGHSAETGLLLAWPKAGPRQVWRAAGI